MKRLPLLLGLMLLLAACEKDIPFNGAVTDPFMVINAIVPQDSLFEIKITQSRFFMEQEDTFETVKNATVELYVNGVHAETMSHAGNGRYVSNYKVTEGDLVRIISQAPNLKTTTADMRIVSAANVIRLDTTLTKFHRTPIGIFTYDDVRNQYVDDTIGWNYTCTVNCKLTFRDTPNSENFYRLVVYNNQYYDSIHYYTHRVWYKKTDVVFGEKDRTDNSTMDDGGNNPYGLFTDELFEGKNYPLTFSFDASYSYYLDGTHSQIYYNSGNGNTLNSSDVFIDLQTLSKSYYLYLVTSSDYNPDDLFAEPVQIYTNVIGGTGIVGNYSHHLIPLKLPL